MATPLKVVVWDSIGNTVLGVRPWSSWEPAIQSCFLEVDPDAIAHAPTLAAFLPDVDLDLTWFNSADAPYEYFGQLYADFDSALRFTKDREEIARAVEDADVLILHKERFPAEALASARNLRLIQHLGQECRGVPLAAALERGIPVAAVPLVNYTVVAEQVWAYILNWAKRLPALRQHMKDRDYADTWTRFPGTQIVSDMTLGLLGLGEIARPVARVAHAFGMDIQYWDIERFPELEESLGARYVGWDDLFATSDIVSTHLALNDKTTGIIGAREIGLMRPTTLFINTARGLLVDQSALTDAVGSGRLGAIALDVYANEPPPDDDPLLLLHDSADERITLTKHNGWQHPWTWVRDSQELWANVGRLARGEPLHHLI